LGRRHRTPGVVAAGTGELAVDLLDRAIAPQIGLVVEIDRQHGRIVPHIGLAAIGLIDLQRVRIYDVFPAVVFEIA
jgi:hypothetical protein